MVRSRDRSHSLRPRLGLANINVGEKATVKISASDKALKSTGFGPRAKC